jgi:hypothetical protein
MSAMSAKLFLGFASCQRTLEDPQSGLFKSALRADRALVALVSSLALSLVACDQTTDDHDPAADVEGIEAIEETLIHGGSVAFQVNTVLPKTHLAACSEQPCGEEQNAGCCESEQGTICYSCELPPAVRIEPSECEEHADCGPFEEGNRCAHDEYEGATCYRLCGGALGFTCDEGQICMMPLVNVDHGLAYVHQGSPGFCFTPPAEEVDIDWAQIAKLASPAPRYEHLKEGLVELASPE